MPQYLCSRGRLSDWLARNSMRKLDGELSAPYGEHLFVGVFGQVTDRQTDIDPCCRAFLHKQIYSVTGCIVPTAQSWLPDMSVLMTPTFLAV